MNLFEKNRRHLESLFPRLGPEIFEGFCGSENLSIVRTSKNTVTAQLDGRCVHSKYDPHRESARILDKANPQHSASAVFLGFGLGYQIEEFFRRFPDGTAIIVEKSPQLFLKALTARDFTFLLTESTSLLIGLDSEELQKALSLLVNRTHFIIPLQAVTQTAPEYYSEAQQIIDAERSRKKVNSATVKRFGRRWVHNLADNLETLVQAGDIDQMENILEGHPALVVAAGPSLDNILPYIEKLQQRMVLVATDTSLRALARYGVAPDFILVVDPQYWNSRHLDGLDVQETILISEPSTHPIVFHHSYRAIFLSGSVFPLADYLDPGTRAPHKLGAGGSVTTTAWDFAHYIGASEIYLTGLDLGFPGKRTHYSGSFFEERLFSLNSRFSPYEGLLFDYLHSGEPFYYEKYSGSFTLTDRRLIIYRQWFEEHMVKKRGTTFTLSPEGIKIAGILPADISPLLELPCIRPQVNRRLEEIVQLQLHQKHTDSSARREKLHGRLKVLLDELSAVKAIAKAGLEAVESIEDYSDDQYQHPEVQKAFDELNTIDSQLMQSTGRYVAGFLINPVLEQIQDEVYSKKSLNKSIEASRSIYQNLKDSAQFHIDLFHVKERNYRKNS